jgi:gluconolactonase
MTRIHLYATLVVSVLAWGFHAQADDAETTTITAQGLTLQIPKTWKAHQPSSSMRLAQFVIPAADGDLEPAELVVFPPFGGSISENAKRWVGQFQAENRTVDMKQGKATQGDYVLVNLSGTFNKPDGPMMMQKTKPAPNYRVINVMITPASGGNYTLKLTGPNKTVSAAAEAFRKSFGADASKETAYEF